MEFELTDESVPTGPHLQVLYLIDQALSVVSAGEGLHLNNVLPTIIRVVVSKSKADSGGIVVVDPDMNIVGSWVIGPDQTEADNSRHLEGLMQSGIASKVMRQKRAILVSNSCSDIRWLKYPQYKTSNQPWSVVCVPLLVKERVVGILTVTKQGASQFGQQVLSLLETIGRHTSTTIENARLYVDLAQRAGDLSTLVDATNAMTTNIEIGHLLQNVAQQLAGLLHVDGCALFVWNRDVDTITLQVEHAPESWSIQAERYRPMNVMQLPLTRQVLLGKRPMQLVVDQPVLIESERSFKFVPRGEVKSLLMVPLISKGSVMILAELLDTHLRTFSEYEIKMVQALGNQAAVVIENARLYQATERQLQISNLLNEAGKVINSSLDLQEIMQSLLVQMNQLLLVESASITLLNQSRKELVYQVATNLGEPIGVEGRIPSNKGILGWVVLHAEPIHISDLDLNDQIQEEGILGHLPRAIMCAPLIIRGVVVGTIQALNPIQGRFSEEDLSLLVSLANLAGSAIANAQQFAQTQAAEARYLGLFEDSIDPIVLTNLKGQIVAVNKRACDFLNYPREQLLSLFVTKLHPEEESLFEIAPLQKLKTDGAAEYTTAIITREKQLIPVDVHIKLLLSEGEAMLQWIYHDISKKVELEEMREDLMAMLFHDLQNPLSNIISSLELMAFDDRLSSDPVYGSVVGIALRGGRRLQVLLKTLLDINHLESGRPIQSLKFMPIKELILEAQDLVQVAFEKKKLELVLQFDKAIPDVHVDGDMVRRIFVNLLHNAQKFAPEGSSVFVKVAIDEIMPQLMISVIDQGVGIPEEDRERIFEKYRRLATTENSKSKGLGLGLAFCQLAVEAHGGRIWVDDGPDGTGACFKFTLPTEDFVGH